MSNYIQNDFTKGQQSLEFTRIEKIAGRKIKVHIDRDFYEQQCSARAFVWTDAGWTPVVSRPISEMRAFDHSPTRQNWQACRSEFELDADDLLAAALAVLL